MNTFDAAPAGARLLRGDVLHARSRPRAHAFRYRVTTLLLPMRALASTASPDLARNRAGLYAFFDADHGEGGPDALAWVESLLAREGVQGVDGEIWLQTFPRVLGYVFKPVSFWYGLRCDGTLAAVVAEVNNTFGERHVYLLDGPGLRWGATVRARKVFHVSPFCRVQGEYVFRFMRKGDRLVARVEHHDHDVHRDHDVHDGAVHRDQAVHPDHDTHRGRDSQRDHDHDTHRGLDTQRDPDHDTHRGRDTQRTHDTHRDHDAQRHHDAHRAARRPLLVTSIGGTAEPLTTATVRRAFLRSPLMTLAVTTRIHWHALRLAVKRVPWFSKPRVPPALISR